MDSENVSPAPARRRFIKEGKCSFTLRVLRNCGFAFCFASALLLVACFVALLLSRDDDRSWDFGVMIDAGSSGTRVLVYTWPHPNSDDEPLIQQLPFEDIKHFSVEPGLATLWKTTRNSSTEFEDALEAILSRAESLVPTSKHTPIYLFGTAGMRLLPPIDQENMIKAIQDYFEAHTSSSEQFSFDRENFRIISGQEESAFGWVSANYLSDLLAMYRYSDHIPFGSFSVPQTPWNARDLGSDEWKSYLGALDLGGASIEIAFQPPDPKATPEEYAYSAHVDDHFFDLFAHSWLYFGRDQSQIRYFQGLVDSALVVNPNATSFTSDCFPIGYNGTFTDERSGASFDVNGSSAGYSACLSDISPLLNNSGTCQYENCSFNGAYVPRALPPVVLAFSLFSTVRDIFLLDNNATIADFVNTAVSFCVLDYAAQLGMINRTKTMFVGEMCFDLSYIVLVLRDGLHVPEDEARFLFEKEILGLEVGWSLGAMVVEVNNIPNGLRSSKSVLTSYWWAIVLLVFLLLGVVISGICSGVLWRSRAMLREKDAAVLHSRVTTGYTGIEEGDSANSPA